MTQEDKDLLLRDLCSRLPYGINVEIREKENQIGTTVLKYPLSGELLDVGIKNHYFIRPYLRPMSSMTEEEEIEFIPICDSILSVGKNDNICILSIKQTDWLNSHHFDYRGLIEKNLALEAPEDMYNTID